MPAFGRGERMGADKLWIDVQGRPLIAWTLEAAGRSQCFDLVVIAAPRGRWDALRGLAASSGFAAATLVEGGSRRQDSVAAALARCDAHELVCIHDAARPLAPPRLFRDVVEAARASRAATAGVPCVDTIKRVADGHVVETLDRGTLVATQTPQAFATSLLREAHAAARRDDVDASDDALLVEHTGAPVTVVSGDVRNLKVTHAQDVELVRALVAGS